MKKRDFDPWVLAEPLIARETTQKQGQIHDCHQKEVVFYAERLPPAFQTHATLVPSCVPHERETTREREEEEEGMERSKSAACSSHKISLSLSHCRTFLGFSCSSSPSSSQSLLPARLGGRLPCSLSGEWVRGVHGTFFPALQVLVQLMLLSSSVNPWELDFSRSAFRL